MRSSASRRILAVVLAVLAVAIVGFLAVGLIFPDSFAGQMLWGAGLRVEKEPRVFPSDEIKPAGGIPRGEGLGGGLESTSVTFQGLWSGYCKVWGTDPDHPGGIKYTAGTLKVTVEGQNWQGYCIDLHHNLNTGDTWLANVYASSEPGLCEAHWILANFSRDTPGAGLSSAEEGAAIQAALWYYVEGFQPVWNSSYWCGKQAVYNRAMAIIAAAQGQCIPIPSDLDLSAIQTNLQPGQTGDLRAAVVDQTGQPYQGQGVDFATTLGTLGAPAGVTNPQGEVPNTITSSSAGTANVNADMDGTFQAAAVDPVSDPKQRLLLIKPINYADSDAVQITWEAPTAVTLVSFEATWGGGGAASDQAAGAGVTLRWETASEVDNLGFNVYRAEKETGPWTKLNEQLIPSQVPPGSPVGASYEFVDSGVEPGTSCFYLLEDVDLNGTATQHGPIQPQE